MKLLALVGLVSLWSGPASGDAVTPLFARGYAALPSPQKVTLGANDVVFSSAWQLETAPELSNDIAVQDLRARLADRFHITLRQYGTSCRTEDGILRLAVAPGAVVVAGTADTNHASLAAQAYRLTIAPKEITITGNTTTGLFYGVQTFVQLLKEREGQIWLPEAKIEDWPDMELRIIYWDDAHHLEHLNALKEAIRQASFYKVNGFALKLEGHFQYQHAQPVVEPYALSPSDLQDLTDYGLRYHVQVIPYLDAPAHDAFILKHPEYASLREYPDNNYEFCTTNPKSYQLLENIFSDLLNANRGGKYVVLSTDEPYYVGLADNAQCREAIRAKQLGSVGKLLAEFVTKLADDLHRRGRTVLFWGEYPLKPDDVSAFPSYLINGETDGAQLDSAFRAHGIRQLVYTYMQAEEPLFPKYYLLPSPLRINALPEEATEGRVQNMLDTTTAPTPADVMGVFVAGWADAGLHPETFWLGYATGPAAGWNRHVINAAELQSCFYSLFYGPGSANMGRLYQLMSEGAQFWESSWDTGPSAARPPIWGDSAGPFHPPRPVHDQYLPLLPVPSPELLHLGYNWRVQNEKRLALASTFLAQNDELLDLLDANLQRVPLNRYNLAVYVSIAHLYRQNLTMIENLGRIDDLMRQAETAAGNANANKAVEAVDQALDLSRTIWRQRNQVLQDTTATWYKTWFPRVAEANGRTYLNELDDVKDHVPLRTVDMSYLVYRELQYPLGDWAQQTVASRNQYAEAHHLPARRFMLDWKNTSEK